MLFKYVQSTLVIAAALETVIWCSCQQESAITGCVVNDPVFGCEVPHNVYCSVYSFKIASSIEFAVHIYFDK